MKLFFLISLLLLLPLVVMSQTVDPASPSFDWGALGVDVVLLGVIIGIVQFIKQQFLPAVQPIIPFLLAVVLAVVIAVLRNLSLPLGQLISIAFYNAAAVIFLYEAGKNTAKSVGIVGNEEKK